MPALAVLVVATFAGAGVAVGSVGCSSPAKFRSAAAQQVQLSAATLVQMHALAVGCVGLVFWGWAAWITATEHFDLGAVSFLGAVVACGAGFRRAAPPLDISACRCQRWLLGSACGFVMINYAMGIALVDKTTMRLYFGVGVVWWLAAGVTGVALLERLLKAGFLGDEAKESLHEGQPAGR